MAGVLALSGCFLEEDSSGDDGRDEGGIDPEDPVDAANVEVVSGISGMTVDLVTRAISEIPIWLEGFEEPPPGRMDENATWDATNEVWVLTGSDEYDDGDASGVTTVRTEIQFLSGGTVVQHPDEQTDGIDLSQRFTNEGTYAPGDFEVDFDLVFEHEMEVRANLANGDEGATITGSGSVVGETDLHVNDRHVEDEMDLAWSVDLNLGGEGDCANGVISGSFGVWGFRAELGSSGTAGVGGEEGEVEFVVTHDGEVVERDDQTYPCPSFDDGEGSRVVHQLELMGHEAAHHVAHLLAEGGRWRVGDLGDPDPRNESWDPSTSSWSWGEEFQGPGHQGSRLFNVRYLATGFYQQTPDETTDTMLVEMVVEVLGSHDRNEESVTYDLRYETEFVVTMLGALPYEIEGDGSVEGSVGIPAGNDFGVDATFTLGGDILESRCAEGVMNVHMDDHRYEGIYDGQGGMDWEVLSPDGTRISWSNIHLGCGAPQQ